MKKANMIPVSFVQGVFSREGRIWCSAIEQGTAETASGTACTTPGIAVQGQGIQTGTAAEKGCGDDQGAGEPSSEGRLKGLVLFSLAR